MVGKRVFSGGWVGNGYVLLPDQGAVSQTLLL